MSYRFTLWRHVNLLSNRVVLIVMLNPSTADETQDDPTIRRCIDFARRWNCGRLAVGNLWPIRATNPNDAKAWIKDASPFAIDDNYRRVFEMASLAGLVVAAWGNHGAHAGAGAVMLKHLQRAGHTVHHLGLTREGQPRHPLYVPKDTALVRFET